MADPRELVERLKATGGKGQNGPLKREAAAAITRLSRDLEAARREAEELRERIRALTEAGQQ